MIRADTQHTWLYTLCQREGSGQCNALTQPAVRQSQSGAPAPATIETWYSRPCAVASSGYEVPSKGEPPSFARRGLIMHDCHVQNQARELRCTGDSDQPVCQWATPEGLMSGALIGRPKLVLAAGAAASVQSVCHVASSIHWQVRAARFVGGRGAKESSRLKGHLGFLLVSGLSTSKRPVQA
jgi:hypothetical protein